MWPSSSITVGLSQSCSCRHELDITALTGCLEREEKARTEEAAEHATAAAALQKDIADLQASMHCPRYPIDTLA